MPARLDPVEAARIMREDGGVTPLEPYPGAAYRWKCKCNNAECGAIVYPRLMSVRKGHKGCLHCMARKRRGEGNHRAIAPREAVAIMCERGGVTPLEPYPGSHTPWRCKCNNPECGIEVTPTLGSVKQGRAGCRVCANRDNGVRQQLPDPEAVRRMIELGNAIPDEPYPGSVDKPWRCVCGKCGAPIAPRLGDVMRGQGACSHCGALSSREKQLTPDSEARSVMIEHGVIPDRDTPYPGASTPWKAVCASCGAPIAPTYSTIKGGGGGCSACASFGIDYTAPSYVYIVALDVSDPDVPITIVKVGIANATSTRLRIHKRRGWRLIQRVDVPTGSEAKRAEQAIVAQWRGDGAAPMSKSGVPKGDGFTETVNLEDAPWLAHFDLAAFVQTLGIEVL